MLHRRLAVVIYSLLITGRSIFLWTWNYYGGLLLKDGGLLIKSDAFAITPFAISTHTFTSDVLFGIALALMWLKLIEHTRDGMFPSDVAHYWYVTVMISSYVFNGVLIIFIFFLMAFVSMTFTVMSDQTEGEQLENLASVFFQFQRAFGDTDFVGGYEESRVGYLVFSVTALVLISLLMVLIMLNLIIALMTERIGDVTKMAHARWVRCLC